MEHPGKSALQHHYYNYTYNIGYGLINTSWDEYCMTTTCPVSENTETDNEYTKLLHLLGVHCDQHRA
eukprot:7798180-Ditylum_brightwellii.AAC.1